MRVPVYQPSITAAEEAYVLEAVRSGWISSRGPFIDRFEREFGRQIGSEHVSSVANGTVALHLALLAVGVGPGDEVIVPAFTYVASVNAIRYVDATPVFVDSARDTWHPTVEAVEAAITPRTRAIMAVHLYGSACDARELRALADRRGLKLVEDCAESFGTTIEGVHTGLFGDAATFSFFGNKTVTTGEGGMVVAREPAVIEEMRRLKSHYVSIKHRYIHEKVAFNYRMTNLCAAIGLAQLERSAAIIARKVELAHRYREALRETPLTPHDAPVGVRHSHWMVSFLAPSAEHRTELLDELEREGVETRPFFYPCHRMPMHARFAPDQDAFPVADDLAARGFNLPSWPDIPDGEVDRICDLIRANLTRNS